MKTNSRDLARIPAQEVTLARTYRLPSPPFRSDGRVEPQPFHALPCRRAVRAPWLALALAVLFCWLQWAAQAAVYPVMQFTPEEMDAIAANHLTAPTLLAPVGVPEFAPVVNLLAHLPYTAAERDQGSCGNCWAWAGVGVMEVAHSVQNGVRDRLSVQELNSCYTGRACCQGGWLYDVENFYAGRRFAVPWSNASASWRSGSGSCSAAPCDGITTSPRYDITGISLSKIPTHGVSQTQAIANIKSALNQYKAVWFGFFLPSFEPFFEFWNNQPESALWNSFPSGSSAGHAVLCVGYDDSDPNNRYWIMVNSWGPTPRREHGLFRVAMNIDYNNTRLYWQTLDVQFAGTVQNPDIAVTVGNTPLTDGQTAPVDFGTVALGDQGFARTFTVRNAGNMTLNLGSVNVPAGYRVSEGLPAYLAPGQQNTFTVCLEATTAGTKDGQISIANDDRDENPFNFAVTGRVYQPPTLVWVDGASQCANPDGSQACPYPMVSLGYYAVARCGTVRIRAGTYVFQPGNRSKCALFEASGGPALLTSGVSLPGDPGETPLELSAPMRQPDGTFTMRFNGVAGQRYQVLTSTDLVTWSLWKEFTEATATFDIVDDDAAATPHRFFQVVVP